MATLTKPASLSHCVGGAGSIVVRSLQRWSTTVNEHQEQHGKRSKGERDEANMGSVGWRAGCRHAACNETASLRQVDNEEETEQSRYLGWAVAC